MLACRYGACDGFDGSSAWTPHRTKATIVQGRLFAVSDGAYAAGVDPDEAAEDRRRRERIRANAALLGLPPLTPREFLEAGRDPVSQAKWRALPPRQRAITVVALAVVGLKADGFGSELKRGSSRPVGPAL
jgi:hypothetical protein